MPWWPSSVLTSAKRKAISVMGFCRPVSTLASLTGTSSGSTTEERDTWRMRSGAMVIPRGERDAAC